ncbi:MAG TPA: class I SAM-dependent methyltransferase [Allosphingosinicella sp.]|jgi:SAM-dependent methyltransferase
MHEQIVGLYEENAAAFDRMRGRDLFERPWLDRFAAALPPGGTILDIGCGMGEPIAAYLIGLGFRVTGYDSAPSMIALCRERFPAGEWIVGDMRALDLGRTYDGLLAWHSSFHLSHDDQRRLFPSFAAHTKPGGHLMFTSGDEEGVRIGEWMNEPLYHASLAPEKYRELLGTNGFEAIHHDPRDPECGDATVWLARKL